MPDPTEHFGNFMERFIRNENLKLWRRQLAETTDEQKRAVLIDLIAKEGGREAGKASNTTVKTSK
jgi:hypothetical protein